MAIGHQSFYQTQLTSAISDTDLIIPLDTVPTVSEGFLVIESTVEAKREIIYYTSKDASSVTCPSGAGNGRGYDGTTAVSHLQGATVIMAPVGVMFDKLGDISVNSITTNTGATVNFSNSPLATTDIANLAVTTPKIADSVVTTPKIANDAVTDQKLINGKVLKRQGGDATAWAKTGATNYDMSATDVKIQCGSIASSSTGDVVITFGTAFTNTPIVVSSVTGNNAGTGGVTANCFAEVASVTNTAAVVRTFNTGGGQSDQAVHWIAIGV